MTRARRELVIEISLTAFCTAITLGLDLVFGGHAVGQLWAASTYARGEAIVTRSEIDSSGRGTRPRITYSFVVDGRSYTGSRYSFGEFSSTGSRARRVVAQYPTGAVVAVYYSAADPSSAVLLYGADPSIAIVLIGLVPFNVLMLLFWAGLIFRRWKPWTPSLPRFEDNSCSRIRTSAVSPVGSAILVAVFPAPIVVAVALAFLFNGDPPWLASIIAVFLLPLAGFVAAIRTARATAAGRFDLTVDRDHGVVRMAQNFSKHAPTPIPFSEITAVDVREVEGDALPCSVELTTRDGQVLEVRRALERPAAEEIRDWLRSRIGMV